MSSPHFSSADCYDILDNLIACNKMSCAELNASEENFMLGLCLNLDDIEAHKDYSKPMVFIGIYIAIASLFCIVAMVADLFHGFQKRKKWFPCKFFSLNAASITVIAVSMKLPVDLSSPMPGALDQATKLGSMAFMCTMMANLMPSLASMDNKSLVANFIGLVILVITMIVNICIEINTGVIDHKDKSYLFAEVACIYVVMMLLLLIILTSSVIAIPPLKQILEMKYRVLSKTTLNDQHTALENLRQYVRKYWVMVETSSPQFVMANNPLSFACCIICIYTAVLNLYALLTILRHGAYMDCESDYEWSMLAIYIIQFTGVVVGSITPLFRCNTVHSFKLFTKSGRNYLTNFKVEHYWNQMLCEWKEIQIPFLSSRRRSRTLVHKLKSLLLNLCIGFQTIVVLSCKIIRLIPLSLFIFAVYCTSCLKSLKEMLYTSSIASKSHDTKEDLQMYVLQLEDEMRLAEKTLKGISKSMDHLIQKAKKEENNNLLKFLEKSIAFNGVANFDMDQVQPLIFFKLPNSWSLPIVTLTCIAIVLPNIPKDIVNSLFKYVGEGLVYTRLIEENLNSASEYVNIQNTTMSLWRGVEDSRKWLETTLERSTYNGKTSWEIIEWFSDRSKEIVMENISSTHGELVENFSNKLIAANSMYRISQTLLLSSKSSIKTLREEELFSLLHGMIADIMVACFTNIPRVIIMKCHESVIEKREASIEAAVKLLGRTAEIIDRLEVRKLPSMDPDKMAFIDEWRLHMKQSIP
ncbi:Pentatricopeptide repeat-containing protein [Artemisia annua]|uniref:Pentatricopeptide repeat-containing protein n=1 Tax=Artemisia annua TaxID=35608 RepID=A0A2U1LG65_ARTAN|nr:Pentatricopeptide repeat-containing protein [Artemisia annua]